MRNTNCSFKHLLLLVLIFSTVSFTSCKNNNSEVKIGTEKKAGWKLNSKKPIEFDWYINFSWFTKHWGDSEVSRYITDKTGVSINFIVPDGNEAEKLASLIKTDSLPDILTVDCSETQLTNLIELGLVEPLDILAEHYDPYFFKAVNQETLNWYRNEDNHIYCYPNDSFAPSDYEKYKGKLTSHETFLVRKDIYEAIGCPDMTTPEGFISALQKAKEAFPVVEDQPLIPFTSNEFTDTGCERIDEMLPHYLAISPEKDGKFYDSRLGLTENQELLRWLKTFRTAHEKNLMPEEVFTDKRLQIEEKAAHGRYFCMLYFNWDMQASQHALYEKDPNSIYIAVPGPKNTKGDAPTLMGSHISGWTVTLISKNCRDKARAIQFLTYLISEEGQMDTNFGIPNKHYTMVNGVPTLKPEIKALDQFDKNRQEAEIGVQYTYWMLMNTAWQTQFGIEFSPALEQPELWTKPYVKSFSVYYGLKLKAGTEEAAAYNDIQHEWGRVLPLLLKAPTEEEFDRLVTEFNKYKKNHGYNMIIAAQTKMMQANKKKLGIE